MKIKTSVLDVLTEQLGYPYARTILRRTDHSARYWGTTLGFFTIYYEDATI